MNILIEKEVFLIVNKLKNWSFKKKQMIKAIVGLYYVALFSQTCFSEMEKMYTGVNIDQKKMNK